MPTRTDPLSQPSLAADRPHYATGELLDAEDFQAEQTYHRGRLARALAYLHGSGTVAGLRVTVQPAEAGPTGEAGGERVLVSGGLAIDRLGRMVEIPRPACLRLGRWLRSLDGDQRADRVVTEQGGALVLLADVFVRFVSCERGMTPSFATGPFDALDAVSPSRLRDGYALSLLLRERNPLLPADPWGALLGEGAERATLRSLHQALLATPWRVGTDARDREGLQREQEHMPTQNPEDLFLARLRVPVTNPANPTRDLGRAVTVDEESRRFVYPPGLLVAWLERKLGGLE
jgi:hypothetical protein